MIASHFAHLIIHGWLKNHLHFISYNFNLLSWQFLSASRCMKQDTVPAFPGPSTGNPLVVDKRISLSPVSSFLRDHCGDDGLVAKLSPTFCDPMDYSPPGSSVHGDLQEWVAISFSRGSSQPRNQTHVFSLGGGLFTTEPPGKPRHTLIFRSYSCSSNIPHV